MWVLLKPNKGENLKKELKSDLIVCRLNRTLFDVLVCEAEGATPLSKWDPSVYITLMGHWTGMGFA